MKSGEELSAFDDLFCRIDEFASERPVDGREHDEKWIPPTDGTRLTPEREVGKVAIRFMIFSSRTLSKENGKPLYSPSITVFSGDSLFGEDIKRSDIECRPNHKSGSEKYAELLKRLESAQTLFDQYMQSVSS